MKSRTEIMRELLFLAKTTLQPEGAMGYTMPDGKYHIYIYAETEPAWPGREAQNYYVVEPNEVVNGAHEPMDTPYATNTLDLSEVLIGCHWCMEVFDMARENAVNKAVSEEELPDELVVRLAHEAGWLEAEGKIEIHSWEDLQTAIRDAITEYYDHPSEKNPFTIEETIEKILLEQYPSDPATAKNTEVTKPSLLDRIRNSDAKRLAADPSGTQKQSQQEPTI